MTQAKSKVTHLATKCDNPPPGCFDVELDMEAIAGEVFGLLIEKFNETTNLSPNSNVE